MRSNVRFYPSAAAAQAAGFRACKRCRPDATPGSPEWNTRADVTARAMRLIADGLVDRDGVPALAAQLGYSVRQLQRTMLAEVGAGPLAVARAQRAQTARVLIETTALTMADIAFAAGFSSIRQFNDTVRSVFASSPTELRLRGAGSPSSDRESVFHRPVASAALSSTTLPRQPLWPPGRHRSSGHRGGVRPDLPSYCSAGPRPGGGGAHARSSSRPLPGQVDRPTGPGVGRGPVPVATRPGCRPGGHRPAPEGRPSPPSGDR